MKHIKMSKEDANKWLGALRSGEYEQGEHYLYDPFTKQYCCLGVLEHVLDGTVETTCNNGPKSLPSVEWLTEHGITFINDDGDIDDEPYLPAFNQTASFANDFGIKFNAIADAIEETLDAY